MSLNTAENVNEDNNEEGEQKDGDNGVFESQRHNSVSSLSNTTDLCGNNEDEEEISRTRFFLRLWQDLNECESSFLLSMHSLCTAFILICFYNTPCKGSDKDTNGANSEVIGFRSRVWSKLSSNIVSFLQDDSVNNFT